MEDVSNLSEKGSAIAPKKGGVPKFAGCGTLKQRELEYPRLDRLSGQTPFSRKKMTRGTPGVKEKRVPKMRWGSWRREEARTEERRAREGLNSAKTKGKRFPATGTKRQRIFLGPEAGARRKA